MRLTTLTKLAPLDEGGNVLRFTGPRQELFQVCILEDDLVRVSHYPSGRPILERTWLVSGDGGDTVSYTHLTLPTNREV